MENLSPIIKDVVAVIGPIIQKHASLTDPVHFRLFTGDPDCPESFQLHHYGDFYIQCRDSGPNSKGVVTGVHPDGRVVEVHTEDLDEIPDLLSKVSNIMANGDNPIDILKHLE